MLTTRSKPRPQTGPTPEQLALDLEMLGKIKARHPHATTIREMFDGMKPQWAVEAVARLIERRLVREENGRLIATT